MKRISQKEYEDSFNGGEGALKQALKQALDIRKFEIELYWKRAAYFWTFIGATFAAYGAIQASSSVSADARADLSVISSCLGLVFSWGWFLANRGSKQWQENWENHVDMLEDKFVGPLYKTLMRRPEPVKTLRKVEGQKRFEFLIRMINGPGPYSVTKINQIISLFVAVLWVVLLLRSLPFSKAAPINWEYVIVIALTVVACLGFWRLGKTDLVDYSHEAWRRTTGIVLPENQNIGRPECGVDQQENKQQEQSS